MEKYYFTNPANKEKALKLRELAESEPRHTIGEAFMLLINDVPKDHLNIFLTKIQEFFRRINISISPDECYELTQGQDIEGKIVIKDNDNIKKLLYDLAMQCIMERRTFR